MQSNQAPPQKFYDTEQFPQLVELARNWKIIRSEYEQLDVPIMNISRIGKSHQRVFRDVAEQIQQGNKYGWIPGADFEDVNDLRDSENWLQYGLVVLGNKVPFLGSEMTQTTEMLAKIKGVKVCALAKLNPNSILHRHRHPELRKSGLLQFHLPITTVADSDKNFNYLNVQGEFRQHVCGVPFVFDGSYDHFALNESPEERTVLYMEFSKKALMLQS